MKGEALRKKAEEFHARFDTELKGEYIRMSDYDADVIKELETFLEQ